MTVSLWVAVATVALAAVAHLCALVWCGVRVSFFAGELVREVKGHGERLGKLENRFDSLSPSASAMVGAQHFAGLNG